jgi:two-component system sensor histidine kinase DesK
VSTSQPNRPADARPPEARVGFGRQWLGVRRLIWLVFIAIPLVDAISGHDTGAAKAATIAGAIAFVVIFVAATGVQRKPLPDAQAFPAVAALLAFAVAMTIFDREGWATLFVFTVASIAISVRQPYAFQLVLLCTALCAGTLLARGSAVGTAISFATPTLGIGMLMLVMADLRNRNRELYEARSEIARLAVAEERARFARDLHDLLGHSLSVIALKAELAGRLLPGQAPEAAGHVAEIEQVARGALTEVREAVRGYRQPTLDDELAGAQMALSAAGIATQVQRPAVKLDPAVEAVLAWTVREGATNVIRHSGADHCSVTVNTGLGEAGVEVVDDGRGRGRDGEPAAINGHEGQGLEGLTERVEALHGQIEAGSRPEGGFRLAVQVPVATS